MQLTINLRYCTSNDIQRQIMTRNGPQQKVAPRYNPYPTTAPHEMREMRGTPFERSVGLNHVSMEAHLGIEV